MKYYGFKGNLLFDLSGVIIVAANVYEREMLLELAAKMVLKPL